MRIYKRPLSKIIPYVRNPRNNDAAVSSVAASIKEFGPQQPIVVDADGVIIVGHTRLKAAQQLGLESFPVMVADELTPSQVKAYRIADNRVGELAEWDTDLLKLEIDDLLEEGLDVEITGFDQESIDEMLCIVDELEDMPVLPAGDKEPFQQITFTLHDSQAEQIREAMDAAESMGDYIGSPNENRNGNAIARVAETFLSMVGENE